MKQKYDAKEKKKSPTVFFFFFFDFRRAFWIISYYNVCISADPPNFFT